MSARFVPKNVSTLWDVSDWDSGVALLLISFLCRWKEEFVWWHINHVPCKSQSSSKHAWFDLLIVLSLWAELQEEFAVYLTFSWPATSLDIWFPCRDKIRFCLTVWFCCFCFVLLNESLRACQTCKLVKLLNNKCILWWIWYYLNCSKCCLDRWQDPGSLNFKS